MNPPDLFPAADRNGEVGILEEVQTFSPARDGTEPVVPACSGVWRAPHPAKWLCKG